MQVKQLHLANIANVAYSYARALRKAGRDADVLCYDLNHILSMPEWADGDFELTIEDEWSPPFDHPLLQSQVIPEWYRRIVSQNFWLPRGIADEQQRRRRVSEEWVAHLAKVSASYGPRWALKPDDIRPYSPLTDTLSCKFFEGYDVIFGYAYGAVPPLLASIEPYVPVEIGTLRDTVNIDSTLGRLLALAYRTAPHVVITNADCLSAAHALDLERFSYVPHPLDESMFRPYPSEKRLALKRELCDTEYLLVAPARQAWSVKANDRYLRAYAALVKGGVDVTLMISQWGPDVSRAKELLDELGVGAHVKWFDPVPEGRLAKLFNAADLVLDQFGDFGTFGLIGPKAMSCGTPCLLAFDAWRHEWCFSEKPPVVAVREEQEILDALRHYLSDPLARLAVGEQSREWIMRHHSQAVVVKKMDAIVATLDGNSLAATPFGGFRNQRLALGEPQAAQTLPASPFSLMERTRRSLQLLIRKLLALVKTLPGVSGPGRIRRMQMELAAQRSLLNTILTAHVDLRAQTSSPSEQLQRNYGELIDQQLLDLQRIEGDIENFREDTSSLRRELMDVKSMRLQELRSEMERFQQYVLPLERLREQLLAQEKAAKPHWSEVPQFDSLQKGILSAFDLMGKNRMEDRALLVQTQSELLENMLRQRAAIMARPFPASESFPVLKEKPLSVAEAFKNLKAAAPFNWHLFQACLDRGTESYAELPPESCSTESHPQARLFRNFLAVYLRGNVLDIGCGPQPVPYYLQDYPIDRVFGIDPISAVEDHPFLFVPGVGEYLPWQDQSFDVVISGTTLDHYYLLDRGLESVFRVLRPGGHFVAWITEFAGAPKYDPYSMPMAASYDEEHLFHIDRAWFLPLMKELGFQEVEVIHFEWPFHYLFMSFQKPLSS